MTKFVEMEFRSVQPELERDVHFGPEAEDRGLVARVGTQPLPVALDSMEGIRGSALLSSYLGNPMFRVWIVPHTFSVVRRHGFREALSTSLQVAYVSEGRTCSIQGLLPSPEFVRVGDLRLDVRLSSDGGFALGGGLDTPAADTRHAAGLEIESYAGAGGSLRFRATIELPAVSAVGLGGDLAEWVFGELGPRVMGRDVYCWTFLVVPRRQRLLKMRLRLLVSHRVAFFVSRMDTEWVDVSVPLSG